MNGTTLYEPQLSPGRLRPLLAAFGKLRIGVVGDFCLDVYWTEAGEPGSVSLETGLPTRRGRLAHATPGAAGAVALNLRALGCAVEAFGVVGDDMWGRELRRGLEVEGVGVDGLPGEVDGWETPVYGKPYVNGAEQARLDLGMENRLPDAAAERLVKALEGRIAHLRAVVIVEQLGEALLTARLREALQRSIGRHADKLFVLDSRSQAGAWKDVVLRINGHEAAAAIGEAVSASAPNEVVVPGDLAARAAAALAQKSGRPAIVSRGDRGCIVAATSERLHVPALQVLGKLDAVGAGDALTAAVTAAMAAGQGPLEAAALGNVAAAVVCGKLRRTGTASAGEILAAAEDADLVYYPDLADDPRAAKYIEGTEIEIVSGRPAPTKVTHAIFDHDGTISTLRQGWEAIMEPMMARAILGPKFETADSLTYQRIVERSRDFIDKTTGIQTLIQMQGLAALVREYGFVPENEVLDEHGYKKIYNDELIKMVAQRAERLKKGELEPRDYAMKGAIELLHALKKAGVVLYLASGTDEPDVKAEAAAMGYADLFEGHIYGSTGDVTKDAKKMVLDRILDEIGPEAMGGLIMVGDGPVEIRETRKRGGFTIGVASDEVRRFGMNASKRTRVIRAGCDWLIPDFAQVGILLKLLNVCG
jgi:bifunctional ADP-heptose synthase (sugar kinase/adenylyltransferase)